MKNTAIIAEYNPFHNGHRLNIERAREITRCDNIIVIMSGNFVQRGEPAIFDKVTRTHMAIKNGADMVLELPVEYATAAADIFAGAAVEILDKSNMVSALFFGSEQGDIKGLDAVAGVFANESPRFKECLAAALAKGLSYPAAREKAAAEILGRDISFINNPNNILAIEYMAALKRRGSGIVPVTMKRENGYNETELSGSISSAAAIRQAIFNNEVPACALPENTLGYYRDAVFPRLDDYSDIFAYILRTTDRAVLAETADMTEGLENRFLKYKEIKYISDMVDAVKTRRYTHTKLKRAVLHTILGITRDMQQRPPAYIRVLGVREDKRLLLSMLVQKAELPVIINTKKAEELLENEIRCSDIYYIAGDRNTAGEYACGCMVRR